MPGPVFWVPRPWDQRTEYSSSLQKPSDIWIEKGRADKIQSWEGFLRFLGSGTLTQLTLKAESNEWIFSHLEVSLFQVASAAANRANDFYNSKLSREMLICRVAPSTDAPCTPTVILQTMSCVPGSFWVWHIRPCRDYRRFRLYLTSRASHPIPLNREVGFIGLQPSLFLGRAPRSQCCLGECGPHKVLPHHST